MELHRETTFGADPATVYGVLVDRAFLVFRATRAHALRHEVRIEQVGGAHRTHTVQTFPARVPAILRKFVGETLDLDEVITWQPPGPDGTRTGSVTLSVARVPVRMDGTISLLPAAAGRSTRQVVVADVKASVPLVGRRVEQAALPSVTEAVDGQAQLAQAWLAGAR